MSSDQAAIQTNMKFTKGIAPRTNQKTGLRPTLDAATAMRPPTINPHITSGNKLNSVSSMARPSPEQLWTIARRGLLFIRHHGDRRAAFQGLQSGRTVVAMEISQQGPGRVR